MPCSAIRRSSAGWVDAHSRTRGRASGDATSTKSRPGSSVPSRSHTTHGASDRTTKTANPLPRSAASRSAPALPSTYRAHCASICSSRDRGGTSGAPPHSARSCAGVHMWTRASVPSRNRALAFTIPTSASPRPRTAATHRARWLGTPPRDPVADPRNVSRLERCSQGGGLRACVVAPGASCAHARSGGTCASAWHSDAYWDTIVHICMVRWFFVPLAGSITAWRIHWPTARALGPCG